MEKLICPECGGVIGSSDLEDLPCTCATNPAVPDDDDYRQAAAPAADQAVANEPEKVCRVCGKDVTNDKRRYKDSLGYWCLDCHRADAEARTAGKARCSNCSRLFPRDKLIEIDGDRLCNTCNRERLSRQRQVLRQAAAGRIYKLHEQKQLLILVGIFVLLLLIILLQRLGWI